jgi:hypothetical protein
VCNAREQIQPAEIDPVGLVDRVAQAIISGVDSNELLKALAAIRDDLSKQVPDHGPSFPVGFSSASKISAYANG